MVATAEAAANSAVTKLGFAPGQVVQEIGYDSDVDDDLRFAIEDVIGTELEDEDYGDVADARAALVPRRRRRPRRRLVDALTNLADRGFIVLLTPKAGRPGHVDASDIEEAASRPGCTPAAHDVSAVRRGLDARTRLGARRQRPPRPVSSLGSPA